MILDEVQPLACWIESTSIVRNHVEYNLRVHYGWRPEDAVCTSKRYSDFLALYSAATALCPSYYLPFPPKRMWGNLDKAFVEGRVRDLQQFMRTLLAHPELNRSDCVRRFLLPGYIDVSNVELAARDIDMFLREKLEWARGAHIPAIGWRPSKQYFHATSSKHKGKFVSVWTATKGDASCGTPEQLKEAIQLLSHVSHPILHSYKAVDLRRACVVSVRPHMSSGSLADLIHGAKNPDRKYWGKYWHYALSRGLLETEIRRYATQILEGLQFLHDHNIPYGQLHPGNVLLEKGVAKLTDLEIGLLGLPSKYHIFALRTPHACRNTRTLDVYCLGHVLYEMICGRPLGGAALDEELDWTQQGQKRLAEWAAACAPSDYVLAMVGRPPRLPVETALSNSDFSGRLKTVVASLLSGGELPTVAQLRDDPVFAQDARVARQLVLASDVKAPSRDQLNMLAGLQTAANARLQEEHRQFAQAQKTSAAQAGARIRRAPDSGSSHFTVHV